MTLRRGLPSPELSVFEDKARCAASARRSVSGGGVGWPLERSGLLLDLQHEFDGSALKQVHNWLKEPDTCFGPGALRQKLRC